MYSVSDFVIFRYPGFQYAEMATLSRAVEYSRPTPEVPIFVVAGFDTSQYLHLYAVKEILREVNWSFVDREVRKNLVCIPPFEAKSKEWFTKLVEKAKSRFDQSVFTKVVLSRKSPVYIDHLQISDVFKELCRRYPNAMVFLLYTKETGCWIGATPELLLSGDKLQVKSMSLAGTKYELDPSPWGQKELLEQKIVTDYIADVFREELHTHQISVTGPYEVHAGPVKHLKTDIQAVSTEYIDLLSLAQRLHPTPAVSGHHHQKAKEFILSHEGYDRRYYTGFFGFWNFDRADFFVNLRSMEVFYDGVVLYTGAGITADSIAESEWRETEIKMQTLLSVLR